MTITAFNIVPSKILENTQTPQFTVSNPAANSVKVILDSAVVTNISSAAAHFSCNLLLTAEPVGVANLFIDNVRIEPGETYYCPEIIGQILEDTGVLSTLADTANALNFRVSGREITT